MRLGFFGGQLPVLDELLQQAGPFGTEEISTGQGTISSADNKGVDSLLDQVSGGQKTTRAFAESLAASGSDNGTTCAEISLDIVPAHLSNHITTIDKSYTRLLDRK